MPEPMERLTYSERVPVYRSVVPRGAREASMLAVGATVESVDDNLKFAWQKDALCAQTDPEVFFPERNGSSKDAKRICNTCDAKEQCLDYALENDERIGVWGGLSEYERRKLQKMTDVTS